LKKTLQNRPDLLRDVGLNKEDRELLTEIEAEQP
jgi:tRNA G37 N-methylase TrmD